MQLMPEKIINIALGANDDYSVPLAVTIYSILANYSPQGNSSVCSIRFWVLDSAISRHSRERIDYIASQYENCLKIEWLQPDLNLIPKFHSEKPEPYLRLLLDRMLPSDIERVLWIDCDVVVEGNICDLWAYDIGDAIIGAIIDYGSPTVGFSHGTARTYSQCNIAPNTPHFNSGVMIMNIARWREADVSRRVLEYSLLFEDKLAYMDQDGLNIVIAGNWKQLPMDWNVQIAALQSLEHLQKVAVADSIEAEHFQNMISKRAALLTHPQLIHYITGKPWNSGLRMPLYNRWFIWLRKSRFFGSKDLLFYRLNCRQQAWFRALLKRIKR